MEWQKKRHKNPKKREGMKEEIMTLKDGWEEWVPTASQTKKGNGHV